MAMAQGVRWEVSVRRRWKRKQGTKHVALRALFPRICIFIIRTKGCH